MVWFVRARGREIEQVGFFGREGLLGMEPRDGLRGDIAGEVIARLRRRGRLNGGSAAPEQGFPLAGFAHHQAIKVLKAHLGGPMVEGPDLADLKAGCIVPFAKEGGAVAVLLQDLGDCGGRLGPKAVVAGKARVQFRRTAIPDLMGVAPRQQGGAGRGADGGCVKAIIAQPLLGQLG